MNTSRILQCFKMLLLITVTIGMAACNNESKQSETKDKDQKHAGLDSSKEHVTESKKTKQVKQVFYNQPSPLELSFLFKQEGLKYNSDKLHSLKAIERYNISREQALNLGVYGADLSYAGIFDQQQDALDYYNNCKELTKALGIEQEEYMVFVKRMKRNQDNKDSLLHVISDFFLVNDANLKDGERINLATYALIGGWIEGMYLGTQMVKNNENNEGIQSILLMQEQSINNLIKLLDELKEEAEENEKIAKELKALQSIYAKIESQKLTTKGKKVEEKDGKLILNTNKTIAKISDSTYQEIKNKIAALRSIITQ